MNLLKKTVKSLSKREKMTTLVLLLVFCMSFYKLFLTSEVNLRVASEGKVYTEGLVGEIERINPVFTELNEVDRDISSLVFSGLAKYNSITGEFDEDMATHTLSEDKLTYTFTLKNGLKWHDGEEVTADDVFFTFATVIQSPDFSNPVLKSNFEGIKIEQVDSRTVTFTLNSPNSFFFSGMTVGILPEHALREVPIADLEVDAFNQFPIGSGPYKVEETYAATSDGSMTMTLMRNEDYYGELPKMKQIRFTAFPSITALIENRELWHGAAGIPSSLVDQLNLEELQVLRYELPQYTAIFLNTDSEALTRNKTRLGISKALNKDAILDAIAYKARVDTPLLELNQEDWIYTSNLDEARGALFDSGWNLEEGEEFRTNDDGDIFSLRLIRRDFSGVNDPQEETAKITASLIQSQLKEVGIQVLVESYPLDQLQEIIKTRDYDMLLYGQSLGYNLDTFSYWHSSQANENGLNLSNYQNPKADFNIESIRGTFGSEERTELLEELANIISSDVPAVFLYRPSYYYILDPKVTGVQFQKLLLPVDRFANIQMWDLE